MSRTPRKAGEYASNSKDVLLQKNSYTKVELDSTQTDFTVFDATLKAASVNNYSTFSKSPSKYLVYNSANGALLSNFKYNVVSRSKNSLLFTLTDSSVNSIDIFQSVESVIIGSSNDFYINSFTDWVIQVNSAYDSELSGITDWSNMFVKLSSRDVYIKVKGYNSATLTLNCEFDINGILASPADTGATNGIITLVSKSKDMSTTFWKNVPVFTVLSSPSGMSKSSTEIDNNTTDIVVSSNSTYPTAATSFTANIVSDAGEIGSYDLVAQTYSHSNNLSSDSDLRIRIDYNGTGDFTIADLSFVFNDGTVVYLDNYTITATGSGSVYVYIATDSTLYYDNTYSNTSIVGYKDRSENIQDYFRKRFYGYADQSNLDESNFVVLRDEYAYTNDNILVKDNDSRRLQLSNDTDIDDDSFLDQILVKSLPLINDYTSFGASISNFAFYDFETYEEVTGKFTLDSTSLTYFQLDAANDSGFYYAKFLPTAHIWKFQNDSAANRQLSNTNILSIDIPLKDLGGDTFEVIDTDGTVMSLAEAVRGKMIRRFQLIVDKDWAAAGLYKAFIIKNDGNEVFSVSRSGDIFPSGDIFANGDLYNKYGEEIGTGESFSKLSSLANGYSNNQTDKIFSRLIPEDIQGHSAYVWTNVSQLNTGNKSTSGFSLGSYGYVAGGIDPLRSDVVEKYSDALNLWTTAASLDVARTAFTAFSLNDFGYAVGGSTAISTFDDAVEKYSPILDSWSTVADLNIGTQSLASFALNDFGYAVGGAINLSDVQRYSADTNVWAIVSSLNNQKQSSGCFSLPTAGYAAGGAISTTAQTTAEKYIDKADTWVSISSINAARGDHVAFSLGESGYIAGGTDAGVLDSVEKYLNTSNSWINIPSLSVADVKMSSFSLNRSAYVASGNIGPNTVEKLTIYPNFYYLGKIYSASNPPTKILASHSSSYHNGGNDVSHGYLDSIQFQYKTYSGDLASSGDVWAWGQTNDLNVPLSGFIDPNTGMYEYEVRVGIPEECSSIYWNPSGLNVWSTVSSLVTPRDILTTFSTKGFAYSAGGDNGGWIANVEQYSDGLDVWTVKTSLGVEKSNVASFVLSESGHVIGGNSAGGYVDVLERYLDISNVWVEKANSTTGRSGPAGVSLNGFGYLISGLDGAYTTSVERYSDTSDAWSSVGSVNTGRSRLASFSLNGFCYIAGGNSGGPESVVEKYSDTLDAWTVKTALSDTNYGLAGFEINGSGYIAGGYVSAAISAVTQQYSDDLDVWIAKSSLGTARIDLAGFELNGSGYAAGGDAGGTTAIVEKYSDHILDHPKIKGFAIKIIE